METNRELLLVHIDMESPSLEERVNLLLTPQHYTLKKEALPVKYRFQAQRIAPSLFEGLLEEPENYNYLVYREEDVWVFIAYNMREINDFLLSKGIRPEQVSKLFFAEQLRDAFLTPVSAGSQRVLTVVDGTVVIVPRAVFTEEVETRPFDASMMPKSGGVSLENTEGSLLSRKQAITVASLFFLFAVLFFLEGLHYGGSVQGGHMKLEELLSENPSLRNSTVRESIAKQYRKTDHSERAKREMVRNLSKVIFKGVSLTSLHLDEKSFKAVLTCSDKKIAQRARQLAKERLFTVSPEGNGNDVTLEGKL